MIVRGVVAGIGAVARGSGADAARRPADDLPHGHAAAAQAGPRQRLPGRLHREHRRLRQPDRRRRPVLGALDRGLLRHRRRAVRPGPRGVARADPVRVRARACSGRSSGCSAAPASRPSPARATAACRCRCPTACAALCSRSSLPWLAFTLVVYLFAFVGGFVADLGPRLHADAAPLRHRLRHPARQRRRRRRPGVGRHGVELALHDAEARRRSPRRSAPRSAC